MNKFKFGGINNPDIYIDETVMRMCQTHRRMFIQLATQLIKEGKKDKALKALDYCSEVIPSTTVPHDYIMSSSKEMADDYLALGEKEKGEAILNDLANKSVDACKVHTRTVCAISIFWMRSTRALPAQMLPAVYKVKVNNRKNQIWQATMPRSLKTSMRCSTNV